MTNLWTIDGLGDVAAAENLAERYGLPHWFASAIVARLGPALALVRCTYAARRWRLLIRDLCGRDMAGVDDLGTLKWVYEGELARVRTEDAAWPSRRGDTPGPTLPEEAR